MLRLLLKEFDFLIVFQNLIYLHVLKDNILDMSWYKKILFAQLNKDQAEKVQLNGTELTVYHRTAISDTADTICSVGFMAGSGAMYGKGIYSTYNLVSTLRNEILGYGGVVVEAKVDISNFLIFDYGMAKRVYGNNYRLIDQIKNVIGIENVLGTQNNQESLQQIEEYSKQLEKGGTTSDIAYPMSMKYRLDSSGVRGIVYTGKTDGNVALSYKELNVTPINSFLFFIVTNSYKL